ncbi:MAG: hypothetical protein HYU64_02230 [Armatimonadetes bacterium]|nr:hypothetical protein [Armatimonadota bacterium]
MIYLTAFSGVASGAMNIASGDNARDEGAAKADPKDEYVTLESLQQEIAVLKKELQLQDLRRELASLRKQIQGDPLPSRKTREADKSQGMVGTFLTAFSRHVREKSGDTGRPADEADGKAPAPSPGDVHEKGPASEADLTQGVTTLARELLSSPKERQLKTLLEMGIESGFLEQLLQGVSAEDPGIGKKILELCKTLKK